LVNRLSASASEIFAGAIQDYQRGLVLGDQTFGKGTVQSLQPLTKGKGQLKLTHAKFYRISGDSTQNLGVIPDIKFPTNIDPSEIGESSLPEALKWDKIEPTKFSLYQSLKSYIPVINKKHQQRIKTNPDFIYVEKTKKRLKDLKDDTLVSLNEKNRRANSEEAQKKILELENERRKAKNMISYTSFKEMKDKLKAEEEANEEKSKSEIVSDESKAYINESAQILIDLIKLNLSIIAQHN